MTEEPRFVEARENRRVCDSFVVTRNRVWDCLDASHHNSYEQNTISHIPLAKIHIQRAKRNQLPGAKQQIHRTSMASVVAKLLATHLSAFATHVNKICWITVAWCSL